MAATLAHIKSRMLLPQDNELEDEEDPRSTLIKRLQEYKRFKSVSERISNLPKIERDYFVANAGQRWQQNSPVQFWEGLRFFPRQI